MGRGAEGGEKISSAEFSVRAPGQQHLNFSEKDIKKAVGIEGSGESFFLYTEAFAKISVFA